MVKGGNRGQLLNRWTPGHVKQLHKARRVVAAIPTTLQARAHPGAALTDAHKLASVDEDLAGAKSVETDQRRPRCRNHAGTFDRDLAIDQRRERLTQTLPEPRHGGVHVTAQSGDSTGGHDDVKPHNLARDQQNRSSPASSTNDLDIRLGTRHFVNDMFNPLG